MDENKDGSDEFRTQALKFLKNVKELLECRDEERALKFLSMARRVDPKISVDDVFSVVKGDSEVETAESGKMYEHVKSLFNRAIAPITTPAKVPPKTIPSLGRGIPPGIEEYLARLNSIDKQESGALLLLVWFGSFLLILFVSTEMYERVYHPNYVFEPNPRFQDQHTTSNGVNYYVIAYHFDRRYPQGSSDRNSIEAKIETEFLEMTSFKASQIPVTCSGHQQGSKEYGICGSGPLNKQCFPT